MTTLAPRLSAHLGRGLRPALRVVWLITSLAALALLRAVANSPGAASAFAAGSAFGAATLGLAVLDGWRPSPPSPRGLAIGAVGGLLLIGLPALLGPGAGHGLGMRPQPFAGWVLVTVLVATGEEVLIRGALLDAVEAGFGLPVAIGMSSLAFALIHVPLYGWGVVPLDLAAGVWLAGLRLTSGTLAAPIAAHALADLASWWL